MSKIRYVTDLQKLDKKNILNNYLEKTNLGIEY